MIRLPVLVGVEGTAAAAAFPGLHAGVEGEAAAWVIPRVHLVAGEGEFAGAVPFWHLFAAVEGEVAAKEDVEMPGRYVLLEDRKPNTIGGDALVAATWNQRTLNTLTDPQGISSLAGNQFTLPAGSYRVRAVALTSGSEGPNRLRLFNVTDAAPLVTGCNSNSAAGTGATALSHLLGRFTLAAAKTLELQHYVTFGDSSFGFVNSGDDEVYTQVELNME